MIVGLLVVLGILGPAVVSSIDQLVISSYDEKREVTCTLLLQVLVYDFCSDREYMRRFFL